MVPCISWIEFSRSPPTTGNGRCRSRAGCASYACLIREQALASKVLGREI